MISIFIENILPGVWSEDIEKYPATFDHISRHPELYNFTYKNYNCTLKRNNSLNWCGYVILPETHPDYNKTYNDLDMHIYAHGGLTYSSEGKFGFDTSHGGDLAPLVDHPYFYRSRCQEYGSYRDYDYVVKEIKEMVDQFKEREVNAIVEGEGTGDTT